MADTDTDSKRCREARRAIVMGVVRAEPGLTLKEILERLGKLHERGEWPEAPWHGARQEPYDTGIRQMLDAMRCNTRWGRRAGRWADYPLVAVEVENTYLVRWYRREDVGPLAEQMLPTGEEARYLAGVARDYAHASGCELAFGVTDALERVVRMSTKRGIVQESVDKDGWAAALVRLGVVDEALVPA